jgi:Flp pilus assembly protein TadG
MRSFLRKKLTELRRCQSGNAMMIVALGMPVLIGGTGFAVDTAQWYMWKGELQYAVDQAAIAGAWARTDDATEATYVQRAQQEYADNLSITDDISSTATVTLENFGAGTLNSVVVTASATDTLPFSSLITGAGTTVRVRAQAAFEEGRIIDSCLVAVDDDATGAVTIGGSAEFIAGCGIMAISDAEEAISVNGNPVIKAGTLLSEGGIDDWFDTPSDNNIDNEVIENVDQELTDPFAELEPPYPPQAQVPRTYSCPKGQTTTNYIADSVTTRTQNTYTYWKRQGNGQNITYVSYNYTGPYKKTDSDNTVTQTNVTLSELPAGAPNVTVGPTTSTTDYVQVDSDGNGQAGRIYEKITTTLTSTYVNARVSSTSEDGGAAVLQPGTYTDLTIKCDTVFTSGIYYISGGNLELHSQHDVTGNGVMFVLTNGAGIRINGGADVNLTAMTVSELEAAGVPHDDAVQLDGMLIFEDPDSPGNTGNKLNGNADTILNGTIYLPVSNLDLRGSAGVSTRCLLLVASTVSISGNVQMESFCPPGEDIDDATEVSLGARVRLVS